jgi:hypothetical protein
MSFAQGFQAGLSAVRQFKEIRDERAQRGEMEKLQQQRDAQAQIQSQQAAQERAAIAQGVPLASTAPQAPLPFQPMGLGQGEMSPVAQYTAPGQSPQGLQFQQAASELPTMSQADYLRSQADIYSRYGDPETAAQFMTQAQGLDRQGVMDQRYDAQQRLEQERYNTQQGIDEAARKRETLLFDQGQQDRQLGLDETQREKDGLSALRAAINQGVSSQKIKEIGAAYGLSGETIVQEVSSGMTLDNRDIVNEQKRIATIVKGKNLDQLLKIHADDPGVSPGYSFTKKIDDKGVITLNEVDSEGAPTGQSMQFGSDVEAQMHLLQAAQDPNTAIESAYNKTISTRQAKAKAEQERIMQELKNDPANAKVASEKLSEIAEFVTNLDFPTNGIPRSFNAPGERQAAIAEQYTIRGLEVPPQYGGGPDRPKPGDNNVDADTTNMPKSFTEKVGLRQQKQAAQDKKEQEALQAKKDYYVDFSVDDLSNINASELDRLVSDIEFLPEEVAKAIMPYATAGRTGSAGGTSFPNYGPNSSPRGLSFGDIFK